MPGAGESCHRVFCSESVDSLTHHIIWSSWPSSPVVSNVARAFQVTRIKLGRCCDEHFVKVRRVASSSPIWSNGEGDQFVLGDEFERNGKKCIFKVVFSDWRPFPLTVHGVVRRRIELKKCGHGATATTRPSLRAEAKCSTF
jgi:hypothetical protein